MNAEHLLTHFNRIADAPDAIPRLRRFILDLAVRGKLVEQDQNDEPASELLKRIAAEKKRLGKAGERKKSKPTTDLPSSIPERDVAPGWVITDLQSVCASITDGDHLPPPKTESGIPFLVIGNVRSQTINFAESRFVSPEYYEALDPIRRPRSGDLLYTLVGSYGIPVVVRDEQPFCVQRHIGILRPSKLIDVGFLARVMESRLVFEQVTACATGIAQKTVPLSGLRRLLIPLPPLAEQHRIVAKVDELMALCDRLETARKEREATRDRLAAASLARLNTPDPAVFQNHAAFALENLTPLTTRPEQLKALRQTILNLAVRGKLVEQESSEGGVDDLLEEFGIQQKRLIAEKKLKHSVSTCNLEIQDNLASIPNSWCWVPLGKLISFGPQNGVSPRATNSTDAPKAITLTATTSGAFDASHFKHVEADVPTDSEYWLRDGDLLFQRGNTREYVGIAAYFSGASGVFLYPDLIMKVRLLDGLSLPYVHLALVSPGARTYFSTKATGTQETMPKINQQTLLNTPVPLPPLAEQHRIVAKVDELMAVCGRLEASLATGDDIRGRLLDVQIHDALALASPASAKHSANEPSAR